MRPHAVQQHVERPLQSKLAGRYGSEAVGGDRRLTELHRPPMSRGVNDGNGRSIAIVYALMNVGCRGWTEALRGNFPCSLASLHGRRESDDHCSKFG